ncbi:Cyanovirin-N [Pyronema omphalodes]|nr:Cyanovirin-N [Pyronema omphalodes]
MSFHLSGNDFRIEGSELVGYLNDQEGNPRDFRFNLDEVLGNDDGHFSWGGQNFSQSAQNISFSIEGGGEVPVLRATLQNGNGDWCESDVNLAERLENINGELQFQF